MSEMNFRVGDRVWSFQCKEWGKVIALDGNDRFYPVKVAFEKDLAKHWCEAGDLFFEEIVIPESARTRPKHAFKPGDPVCVRRSSKNALWLLRAFVEERNGEFVCVSGRGWQDGWPECVPYDPTLLGFDAVEEKKTERNG